GHRIGDLVRLAEAPGGDVRGDLGAHVLGHRHHHVGGDVAGRYRVHGDAQLRVLACQRNGEAVHAGFRRRIVRLAVLALEPVDRADLDDAAPLALAHAFDHRTGDVEHRVEVGVDDIAPLPGRHLVEGAVAGDAGVVDKDVDGAERPLDFAHHGLCLVGRGHVALDQGE